VAKARALQTTIKDIKGSALMSAVKPELAAPIAAGNQSDHNRRNYNINNNNNNNNRLSCWCSAR